LNFGETAIYPKKR